MFVRGGAIIPTKSINRVDMSTFKRQIRDSTYEMKDDPICLTIYPDIEGNAILDLYIDDGVSMGSNSKVDNNDNEEE